MLDFCVCGLESRSQCSILGSWDHWGNVFPMVSLCVILCLTCSGSSLHVLYILLSELLCLSACSMMLVSVVFAMGLLVGGLCL